MLGSTCRQRWIQNFKSMSSETQLFLFIEFWINYLYILTRFLNIYKEFWLKLLCSVERVTNTYGVTKGYYD